MTVTCYVCKQPLNYVTGQFCNLQISLCDFEVCSTLWKSVYAVQVSLNQLQQRSQCIKAEQKVELSC